MYNSSFFKKMLLVAGVTFLYSCDKEFNAVGDGLIGDNHFDLLEYTSDVVAYNQKIGPVQSDNLPVNPLGIYDDPAFGKTTANFGTQVILASANPTIGDEPVIDSVYLSIPYYSTLKTTNTDGSHVYELDSIYGASKAKIKLSVYESGYYMRDLDPVGGFQQPQKYFTDQNTDFESAKIGNRLNDFVSTDKEQNDGFFFDPKEIVEVTKDADGKDVTTRSVPAMRLKLNSEFFKNKIINAPAGKLATNDVFKEYFRGLYFKVENADGSAGSLAMLNFKGGKITIKYKAKTAITTDEETVKEEKSIVLNLSGNTVSLQGQTDAKVNYANATNPANINTTEGDDKLYLRGGEGAMSIVELFDKTDLIGYDKDGKLTGPNGVSDELDNLRYPADGKKLLINEANLVFHIDPTTMANSYEPNRIYLYDLNNDRPVVDYYNDLSKSADAKKSKYVFDGIINKEDKTGGRGLTYKIRITNQIRNLINNADSTNVKFGLVVTEDINTITSSKLKSPNSFSSYAPKASVMNPLGTVLYGTKSTVPADKRLKLEIYYTKPN
ncbi:DUF4270 domain-containing protein [Flavobacterium maritimum]|uniref:DUF4270 domain-containing protein n=1 Tax=Flavobacterium maritimum TaxID=3149042 RepID=UPI0032B5E640